MITTSDSLCRERDAQSSGRRSTSRHVRFRAFPRSNRIQATANIANCFATSSTTEQRVFWPWPLWQFFFPDASSGAHTDVASLGCLVRLLVLLPPTARPPAVYWLLAPLLPLTPRSLDPAGPAAPIILSDADW